MQAVITRKKLKTLKKSTKTDNKPAVNPNNEISIDDLDLMPIVKLFHAMMLEEEAA